MVDNPATPEVESGEVFQRIIVLEDGLRSLAELVTRLADMHDATADELAAVDRRVQSLATSTDEFIARYESDKAIAQDVFVAPPVDGDGLSSHEANHVRAVLARFPNDAPPKIEVPKGEGNGFVGE